MARVLKAIMLGSFTALLGILVYGALHGLAWEEGLGLRFLFQQRGPIPAPTEVVVVNVDRASAEQLKLPNDLRKWPRELHAQLIDRLSLAGAAVVTFDVYFKDATDPKSDQSLATALARAGNVILFAFFKREILHVADAATQQLTAVNVEHLAAPLQELADAAAGIAPFTLPRLPVQVSQFWTFRHAGDAFPTLPMLALYRYTQKDYAQLWELINTIDATLSHALPRDAMSADPTRLMTQLRTSLQRNPRLAATLMAQLQLIPDGKQRQGLQAWVDALTKPDRHYLNFYGPPRSITTLPYAKVLEGKIDENQLRGKVVFVGHAERMQPDQKDNFYTVFSQSSGLDLSGVEIAATAFANLLERTTLRLPTPFWFFALIIGYGLLIAFIGRMLPTLSALAVGILWVAAYVWTACYLFEQHNLWLPLTVPVLIQTPVALFLALLWRQLEIRHEGNRIRQAFGYYLPEKVVDRLARDALKVQGQSELMFGICLATDAEKYTQLSEKLDPQALAALMNRYYEVLFEPVRRRGGIISDVEGDAMLAIWSAPHDTAELRQQACSAALEIADNVAKFNQTMQQTPLPTRIGIHAGQLALSHVGAMDHYEYRAVGDIVNTANRIQGLNKQLGCRLLVSEQVLAGLDGFLARELGGFRLVGKQRQVRLFELLDHRATANEKLTQLYTRFATGLAAYQAGSWAQAVELFASLHQDFPADGPTHFYLQHCRVQLESPTAAAGDGVINVSHK